MPTVVITGASQGIGAATAHALAAAPFFQQAMRHAGSDPALFWAVQDTGRYLGSVAELLGTAFERIRALADEEEVLRRLSLRFPRDEEGARRAFRGQRCEHALVELRRS